MTRSHEPGHPEGRFEAHLTKDLALLRQFPYRRSGSGQEIFSLPPFSPWSFEFQMESSLRFIRELQRRGIDHAPGFFDAPGRLGLVLDILGRATDGGLEFRSFGGRFR